MLKREYDDVLTDRRVPSCDPIEEKSSAVRRMFDGIASRYDLMNRIMTLGQDQRWRRFVVAKVGDFQSGMLLDMACGTGDISSLLQEKMPGCRVVAADFSFNMLKAAGQRFSQRSIAWHQCDANRLPYGDDVFDAVTFGYLLRNVTDVAAVLNEVLRVLKPGGRVVCLDTTPPASNFYLPLLKLYFRLGIPFLGKMLASNSEAYQYLTGSTMGFCTAEQLCSAFAEAGFVRIGYKKFMLGTIAVHWAEKSNIL